MKHVQKGAIYMLVSKAKTHINTLYLLLLHCNNGNANALQCYVESRMPCVSSCLIRAIGTISLGFVLKNPINNFVFA